MDLRRRARSATLWSAVQQVGINGVNVLFTLVFARFLTAEDFGLFAAASLLMGFVLKLAVFGMQTVIVQREEMDTRVLSTAFWMVLAAALLLAGITSGLAKPIAGFFEQETLAVLIPFLAFGMVASAGTEVIAGLLRRRLEIKILTQRTLISGLLAGLIALPFALLGYGVWALVIQAVGLSVLGAVVTYTLAGRPVTLAFDPHVARDLLRRGAPIFLTDTLKHFNSESPRIFVGLFLSIEALGVFTLATRILNLMLQVVLTPLSMIGIPVFSEINRSDRARLPVVFAASVPALIALVLPIIAVAILSIDGLVRILLGPSWTDVGAPAALLLVGALLLPLAFLCDSALVGAGNTRGYLGFSALRAAVGTLLLTVMAPFGIVLAALAFVFRGLIVEPAQLVYSAGALGTAPGSLAFRVLALYGITAVAAGIGYLAGFVLFDLGDITGAFLAVVVFASVYVFGIWWFARDTLATIRSLALGKPGEDAQGKE